MGTSTEAGCSYQTIKNVKKKATLKETLYLGIDTEILLLSWENIDQEVHKEQEKSNSLL